MWILLAGALALLPRQRLALFLLLLSTLLALYQGVLTWPAAALLLTLALLAGLRQHVKANRWAKGITESLLVAASIGLFLHLFPGFHNPQQISAVKAGPQSLPFSFYFNFDKTLIPFLLLACLPTLFKTAAFPPRHYASWIGLFAAIPLLLFIAVLLGGLGFETHFPDWIGTFMLAQLFVCLAEEAFFRGFIQHRLRQWLGGSKALLLTSLLFGLAHFSGGTLLVIFATLAGVIYGLAWHWSGRLWVAVGVHFAFNMTHLLFFTYPALQH